MRVWASLHVDYAIGKRLGRCMKTKCVSWRARGKAFGFSLQIGVLIFSKNGLRGTRFLYNGMSGKWCKPHIIGFLAVSSVLQEFESLLHRHFRNTRTPRIERFSGFFVSGRALCSVRFLIGQFFMETLGAVAPVGGDAHGFLGVAFFYGQRLADTFHQAGFTGSPSEAFASG